MKSKRIFRHVPQVLDVEYVGLRKIISGGQTGADQAGLFIAEEFNLDTGGFMPAGYRTVAGFRPDFSSRFGMQCTESSQYPDRTKLNVQKSDATIRLASDFTTAGEKLTLNFVNTYNKPCISISLLPAPTDLHVTRVVDFLINFNVETLNVAGNADRGIKTFHFDESMAFLRRVLHQLESKNYLIRKNDSDQ